MLAIEDEYGHGMPDRIQSTKPEHIRAQKVDDYQPPEEDTKQVSELHGEINEGAPSVADHESGIRTVGKSRMSQNVLEGAQIDTEQERRDQENKDVRQEDSDEYEDEKFDATIPKDDKIPDILKDKERIKIVQEQERKADEKPDEIEDNYE